MARDITQDGFYSPTGVYGDATLATSEKGKIVAKAFIAELLKGIEKVRSAPLPKVQVQPSRPLD